MKIGDQVKIEPKNKTGDGPAGCVSTAWWPKGEVTGTIQKFFKNGKIAVAVHQLRNRSDDGYVTMNFDRWDLTVTA